MSAETRELLRSLAERLGCSQGDLVERGIGLVLAEVGEVKQYDHRKLQAVQEAVAEGEATPVANYTLAGVLAEIDAS